MEVVLIFRLCFQQPKILGCKKNSAAMGQFVTYLEGLASTDYTNESDFLGQANRWFI